jgi:hypothetical protein
MCSTSRMLFHGGVRFVGAVVVAASTVCFGGDITGICHTAPLLTIVIIWPLGARIFPVW